MISLLIVIFICFIGVGLPDSVLGSAWPVIYKELNLPISLAGYISATVSACTIVSSLISAKVIKRFGAGGVTAISTVMTAVALFGFAVTKKPVCFFVMAIPLGLGAGSIDTALNNFVALHYSASKMNFLHCFYGLGIAVSPYLMSAALSVDNNWRKGYVLVAIIQSVISVVAIMALPLWKKAEKKDAENNSSESKILSLSQMFRMPMALMSSCAFFASCALELTAGAWSSSFFVNTKGVSADRAAQITMLFYVGLASGRFISGILTKKLSRWKIVYTSSLVMLFSIVLLMLPLHVTVSSIGLFFIGMGIGPIFPNLTHLTPKIFGRDISGSIMGLQQTASYLGIMLMPWTFGLIAENLSTALFPFYLFVLYTIFIFVLLFLGKKAKRTTF
ncbi:MAG: MFS transporter [Clostridiales bacterium]|nr:MFS transporter [Clostridiales bacterium]